MSNTPVATAYTHAFIRSALPAGARNLLEVGCGNGELAERLMSDGFEIVAVDADPACVETAKARGVDARLAAWPADLDGQFDAILFTRSLHHVHALGDGVQAAARALRPGGRVIVEDFRAEGGSARSADWYRAMVRELASGGMLTDDADVEALLGKLPPASHGGHELHGSQAIAAALDRRFEVSAAGAAYYFRYLEPCLRDEGAAQWLLDVELERIAAGEIDPLGQRFLATPR
jgi:2-polyprenyl-3-methyl-5-hydroxy-6-metoxy-1,4-benzoquinol methylase